MSEYTRLLDCSSVEELLADPARWHPDAKGSDTDRFCLLWAIDRIYGCGTVESRFRYKTLIETLQKSFGLDNLHNVSWWESRPERTHAEVLDAVRRAQI